MKWYIRMDESGYLLERQTAPFAGSAESDMPDEIDYDHMGAYRLINGEVILDGEKVKEQDLRRLAIDARAKRDELLKASDRAMTPDYPITEEVREAWKIYRQALRDLPEQPDWPENVEWPVSPK